MKAVWETIKFILRVSILVGVPAVLSALVEQKPEWGVIIGLVLTVIDKLIHELPVRFKGLLPF
jgi:hypothetical protein